MALPKLSDEISLQMKTAGKEQLTEKNNGFLQNMDMAEGAMQNLLREFTKMDHILDRSDDGDSIFSKKPQTDFLRETETTKWNTLELEAEHRQDDEQNEQNEQETNQVQHEDPHVSTSLQFSEGNIPEVSQENMFFQLNHWNTRMGLQVKELRADHTDWIEKINNIVQKINLTENTVKSLLTEVMSLEGQIEKLGSHQDLDADQGANIEEKIMEVKKQLEEMDNKCVQEDVCNEAHELKEKLIARIKNFCKDMTLLNTKLGMYQKQEEKLDSQSPEEMGMEGSEPLLPQVAPAPLVQNTAPGITMWKRALRIFIIFYVLTFTGLSCYILVFDATFIFESLLPAMLGRRRMWELREIIEPFLNLEVEDLLPS
ncbi:single-pass membrane and coiled-coil domain-containing protein 2 isoform X1 [Canis lupus familiaris]|uniref:single-pass membrane and coiled-coil domain-containing protein 2 isoform X1 n=2 Tax=Canis lupus familiaris TaxID=9615 RepID=UPI00004A6C46|nr:single-pass membrane and coiled-coil domain-containing protein 2 isoform X1 [Canis lupus familiaris]XP_005637087.1 single-pass membrane and coiled-coil domain-containing protein 2 isoform X1 [Canis lupus familiaris]XP_038433054.1 single-pass membrane and coiled-coil domain-containing protein 2 isoform X1 [Canis lupus familiaris]XP_038433055.1 single-pass membrane and coiled-coil domain-containing protein 2 isoform X1 [Canis lupus familiaris]|eukprot:XP_005637086.1 single-pass membrane and coiled-coil domain-containing protein 2 isoform X1 [Canis lupus familiaris]